MYSIKYFRGYSIKDIWNQFITYFIAHSIGYSVHYTWYSVGCVYIYIYRNVLYFSIRYSRCVASGKLQGT